MSHIHLNINNVSFEYHTGTPVLKNINLAIGENESVGIIGANGTGKSTLLKLLVGLNTNFTGEIRVEEIPLEKKTLNLIRQKIGYVFQDAESQLFMTNVKEDVAFAPRNYGLPEEEVQKRVEKALELVNITHLKDKAIYTLSGGEKKLASIATILSLQPDIIIMDEPSIALDPKNRRTLINTLNSFTHLKILTSHDLDFIWDTCTRVILMNKGTIVADGKPEEILTNRTLLETNGLELPLSLQTRGR